MKKKLIKLSAIFLTIVGVSACGSENDKKKSEMEKTPMDEIVLTETKSQPDENFYEAIVAYNKGDKIQCAVLIDKGIQFIAKVQDDADDKGKPVLEKQIIKLSQLSVRLKENKIKSEDEIIMAFENAEKALAGHAIIVTETLVEMDSTEQAIKTTHTAGHYLEQAQKIAKKENKILYQESIDDLKKLGLKTKEDFGKGKKDVIKDLHKIKDKLLAIDDKMEGPVPL